MTRPKKPLVREVNPHLICILCEGYFIEASTIIECLHSFCRSCLIKYLEKNKFCPICDVQLHKNNPILSVRCDPILQRLVYKLVPGLYAKEMARRRKYYSELGGPSSDSDNFEYPIPDAYFSPTDCISLSLEFLSGSGNDESGSESEETVEKQGVHHRRYLQCQAAVNMSHLKKFLRMKYDLNSDYDVEILHAGEVLTDEFSLMDVAYTFLWNKTSPMRFQFRLVQKQRAPKFNKVEKPMAVKSEVSHKNHTISPEENNLLKLAEEAEAKLVDEEENNRVEEENNRIEEEDDEEDETEHNNALDLEEEDINDKLDDEDEEQRLEEEEEALERAEEQRMEEDEALERLEEEKLDEEEAIERLEEEEANQRIEEEALIEEETIEEVDEDDIEEIPVVIEPPKEKVSKKTERINGLKRPSSIEIPVQEVEPKRPKLSSPPKIDLMQYKQDEKKFLEDMIVEEDTDEDRLRISASEEEKSPDPQSEVEKVYEEKPRSEERRKKKSKKGKHHHHHRHHDRKKGDITPTAQIVHSPENDLMKLKVKLTAIKTTDNLVKGYTVSEGIDTRKEYKEPKENGYKHSEKSVDKVEKTKYKEDNHKKTPSPVRYNSNNNNNTINNNKNIHSHPIVSTSNEVRSLPTTPTTTTAAVANNEKNNSVAHTQFSSSAFAEYARRTEEMNKEKFQQHQQQLKNARKVLPKINGTIKPEPLKMPPSSITVSKITAEEKRLMEQQKLLMNRNQSNGLDPKRPSLEIMLVNAPKKVGSPPEEKPVEPKKVMRPTPPSIPLSKLGKGLVPLRAVRTPEEALDLSGKSSRKSPEALRIPTVKPAYVTAPARPCRPNQSVRQIPNPSALLQRSALLGRQYPPPALPISSLRQMETMTKKIEKVAAGLKAAAAGGFAPK